ncbi:MAG TPA: hypothetical protein VEX86_16645 [Longimicrobium sp.]|nr:hypothetical protein [Longimicrobium sp.]
MAQNRPPKKGRPVVKTRPPHPPHTPHCRCGSPMHPDRVETQNGKTLERYSCPNRHWWNGMWHPRTWMEPRGAVTE